MVRAVGKSKAMDMCLTGEMIDAKEARDFNLVSRVVPSDEVVDTALKMGAKIASFSQPITAMCKEAVNVSYEVPLAEGIRFERRLFHVRLHRYSTYNRCPPSPPFLCNFCIAPFRVFRSFLPQSRVCFVSSVLYRSQPYNILAFAFSGHVCN